MKRKTLAALILTTLIAISGMTAGCGMDSAGSPAAAKGESSADGSAEAPAGEEDGEAIRLVNNKVEVDSGLKELAAAYEKETGVRVTVETLGSGLDPQSVLKDYEEKGDMPDLFVMEGDKDYSVWEGKLADLSDSAWVADTDAEYEVNGTVYGFPCTTEAIGLAYNADILDRAGVDPETITSPSAMREAFESIDGQKEELGLDAVVGYYTEASALHWSTGQHLFGAYLDEGLGRDDTTYIDLLSDGGKVDDDRLNDWAEMVELFNQYSDPELMVSGSYDQQVLNFTSGKYAFVTQGSWIGAIMVNDDADEYSAAGSFPVGMIPYAFQDGQDTILTSTPSWWAVYREGAVDLSKDFLEWCARNDGGQQILVETCGFISPYKSCTWTAEDPFAQTILDYTQAGRTSAWHWLSMKDGLGQNATAVLFQDFAAGTISGREEFVSRLKEAIAAYYGE